MNREARFIAWAARARQEQAPRLDVATSVLRRIQMSTPRREFELPWVVFSAVSVLAALLMVAVALDRWQSMTDPLAGLFSALTLVMQ
jgi:hypothetical protein